MFPATTALALAMGVALLLAAAPPARAAAARTAEVDLEYASLSGGEPDWRGLESRLTLPMGEAGDSLDTELSWKSRFGEEPGVLLAGSYLHQWNESSYQTLSLATTTSGDFWPTETLATEYFRKFGPERHWVTGLAIGQNSYRTSNSDGFAVLELVDYLSPEWVFEVGGRATLSQPGDVGSARVFAATTFISRPGLELTGKLDLGDEAYQVVSQDFIPETRYDSWLASLDARIPIGGGRSIHALAEYYANPYYDRGLGQLGISQAF